MAGYKFSPADSAAISLNAATSGTGAVKAFNDSRQVNWLIVGSGTIDGGTVVVESAEAQDASGTWNELDSIDASTLTGGKRAGGTYPVVPGGFVRIRISSSITGGGSITGYLNGFLG